MLDGLVSTDPQTRAQMCADDQVENKENKSLQDWPRLGAAILWDSEIPSKIYVGGEQSKSGALPLYSQNALRSSYDNSPLGVSWREDYRNNTFLVETTLS